MARQKLSSAHRLKRMNAESLSAPQSREQPRAMVDCGWGRLIFAQTFESDADLPEVLRGESAESRDIAFYVRDPQVAIARAPQEVFLDPSLTWRLDLATYRPARRARRGFHVRRLTSRTDAQAINAIYAEHAMVPVPEDYVWSRRDARTVTLLVAEDDQSGELIGTVMGVDHGRAFDDPARGASLWSLAVSARTGHPGVGEALVRRLAELFQTRGAAYMDLSVLHDNAPACALYEKLGFRRINVFTLKRRNVINQPLFIGELPETALNPYARIIVNEARRRGIGIEIIDAEGGIFRLTHGGRSVLCREALSELTSAVALSICDDKRVTRRVVARAGLRLPDALSEDSAMARRAFLAQHGSLVVKPARGEQGKGVAVGLTDPDAVEAAVEAARALCPEVIVETCFTGTDLRLVVIGDEVVAAAIRKPACVTGDGVTPLRALAEAQSRRRASATGGESRIPFDAETDRCIADQGLDWDSIPDSGREVALRRAANLHTGGTIVDVTDRLHPVLRDAALTAARAIGIPVTGIDLMVKDPSQSDYVFIEANERPGLANHEPRPTAERFVDLLFPLTVPATRKDRHDTDA
ncbi:GNAT-family acetyltransferase TIGR03103 [Gemmobacter megaterium]|uniref:GNAT-family acetyltransferase TIGR03103 n=1 Tax=Gemmobacter megaterium TaxID=1086013 RepID=A0A1N7LPF6_9RHOB|nr:N-acetylglutaminylglutamine synthetase [Gemmobacter megaterium]GGE11304.1 glutathione synthase [Gemmobacter megaterium]SIS75743.1 GNAT-family acetyltransferase TIGR03103 [Gemmobacter megaterium]